MYQVRYVSVWFVVYNVYWYDVLRCSVMHGWCMSGVLCYGNEWMNERVNAWINERVGNVEWLCILLSFICICNMSLYLFRAIFIDE